MTANKTDPQDFLRRAREYYAIAILISFARKEKESLFSYEFESDWEIDEFGGTVKYLEDGNVLASAISYLSELNIIQIIDDDFAPTIVRRNAAYQEGSKILAEHSAAYRNYLAAKDNNLEWLKAALYRINKIAAETEFPNADVSQIREEQLPSEKDIWEPIQIDQQQDEYLKAAAALDEAIEAIRKDNGYASDHAKERNGVLATLRAGQEALKEKTEISVYQIKHLIFAPLKQVLERFGKSAVGLTTEAAREAMKNWLKTKISVLLDWIIS